VILSSIITLVLGLVILAQLAGFEPLYSRAFFLGIDLILAGIWLDQRRFGPENPNLGHRFYALQ